MVGWEGQMKRALRGHLTACYVPFLAAAEALGHGIADSSIARRRGLHSRSCRASSKASLEDVEGVAETLRATWNALNGGGSVFRRRQKRPLLLVLRRND
ncbi:hypothetical protein BJY59DRAFT_729282 [Rhodotorula toruloides]